MPSTAFSVLRSGVTPSTVTVSPIDPTASERSRRERAPSLERHGLLEALEALRLDLHQILARRQVDDEIGAVGRGRRRSTTALVARLVTLTCALAMTASDGSRTMPGERRAIDLRQRRRRKDEQQGECGNGANGS